MGSSRQNGITIVLFLVAAAAALCAAPAVAGSGSLAPRILTPPDAPDTITGPDYLYPNESGLFTVSATDPDTDSVFIAVYPNMNDTTRNVVFGPVPSGVVIMFGAAYDSSGSYTMRARARDMDGAVSPLSPRKFVDVSEAKVRWAFQTADGDGFYSSPAVNVDSAGDTLVYVGCDNALIYSFDARTGGNRRAFQSFNEDAFSTSPAISADGERVYIADDGGWLYCLRASNLALISHYPPNDTWVPGMQPFYSTPAVHGNRLYVGRDDNYFYRFDDNAGSLVYVNSYSTNADISSSPAVNATGDRIVVGNDSGYVYCNDADLGFVWRRRLGGPVTSSPAITPDGTVYVGSDDARLYALSISDGSDVYSPFQANDFITSSPVVDASNTVYFSTDEGTTYAVRNGVQQWATGLWFGENVSATACLAPDSTLLINTDDGSLYALDIRSGAPAPGAIVYRREWPEPHFRRCNTGNRKNAWFASSPTIGPGNGLAYAGSTNGGFFAVSVNRPGFLNGRLPDAPWPKFHHDIQNRGVQTILSGIGERPSVLLDAPRQSATILRGVLEMPEATSRKPQAAGWLLNATGRCVAELHPGLNDVSGMAPGVYFLRTAESGGRTAVRGRGEVRKVVIQR